MEDKMKKQHILMFIIYCIGQIIFRLVLFSRSMYYYEWTMLKETILVACMIFFLMQHYGLIAILKKKLCFTKLNTKLLKVELTLCVCWVGYILFFLIVGIKFSKFILLEIVFNIFPVLIRIIWRKKTGGQV